MKLGTRQSTKAPQDPRLRRWQDNVVGFFAGYFWLIFKNVIGWVLVLSSPVLGLTFPGPGGATAFLIGFALVTFPGKRKLTSRVMRGRGLPIETQVFTFITALLSIAVTCVVMYFIVDKVYDVLDRVYLDPRKKDSTYAAALAGLMVTGLLALGITWLVMRLSLRVLNYVLRGMPMIRRRLRPWLRKKGLNVLPSRRKKPSIATGMQSSSTGEMDEEIIQIAQRHHIRLRVLGVWLLLWGRRAIAVGITVAIFIWILKPIYQQWDVVSDRILETSAFRFAVSVGMFASFLFLFRAMVWWKIVASFGHRIPLPAATRIWSTSELARYVPGFIWQVMGRVYLVRPYGVSGSVCSITQVLELAIFLLANILVALSCLVYFGIKNLDGVARGWLFVAAALLPALLILLHTKIFYGIINRIMHRLGKPPIVQRLRGYMLVLLLLWNIVGLLWQSLAIFLIVQEPLDLKWSWWWVVAGAYCLAWCAGFLAFWAPGGVGVREVVFIGAMQLILPEAVRQGFAGSGGSPDAFPPQLLALLGSLSVLLRLWATGGELLLAAVAYTMDFRGALGKSDAPGRMTFQSPDAAA